MAFFGFNPQLFPFIMVFLLATLFSGAYAETSSDPCTFDLGTTPLYTDFYVPPCSPPRELDANGDCPTYASDDTNCESFCQMRTSFYYGQEVPILRVPFINAGTQTWWNTSIHAVYWYENGVNNYATQWNADALRQGIEGGFHEGPSFSWNDVDSVVDMDDDDCGYFAWIPYVEGVCGTYSRTSRVTSDNGDTCQGPAQSTPNVCIQQTVPGSDPYTILGVYILNYVDCINFTRTDNITGTPYQYPGVALPDQLWESYVNFWENQPIGGYLAQNSSADCASVNAGTAAPFSDCLGVVSGLQASANASLPANLWDDYGSTGIFEVLTVGGCTAYLVFDENWGTQTCDVLSLEMLAAASTILDSCYDAGGDATVRGLQPIRPAGDCASSLLITNPSFDSIP